MKKRQPKEQPQDSFWREVFEREMAEMMNDPNLSDEETAELVRQVYLPDDE